MIRVFGSLSLAALAASHPASAAHEKGRESAFRPGVSVELLHRQPIGDVYFTDWFARLESAQGAWRDVYFETSDKFVNKGIIRLNCEEAEADIDIALYGSGDYGAAADLREVRVPYADRRAWADGGYVALAGETPPFKFYRAALARYCAS
ncbi:hypothetical protein [Sphingopyxis flava]|uniref:Uncharacterized protein n=1 Tax=Sphingopyxis flava TaxID=1507287 RepID=A0A1T5C8W3_9SPHN|nr:hypothetical protein [Sphingopyxis flava]SKB55864.1 hypothetical protein SAMN06295937_100945 [Sphingopyxis flava]